MKDYLNLYGKKAVTKHQMGGTVDAGAQPATASAPEGGQDIQGMLAEFAQSQDPNLAVAICNAIIESMSAQGAPEGGQPAPAAKNGMRFNIPVFKKGGKLKA